MSQASSSPAAAPRRIVSLDQFRGYTVLGMFVVNFLAAAQAIPAVFKHNETYFSYADSIMPSFLFAAGCSFRLTWLRRRESMGAWLARRRFVRRSLTLVMLSLVIYGFGDGLNAWKDINTHGVSEFLASLLKADLWEVLAIIGVTQILLLPVIGTRPGVRLLAALACIVVHIGLSYVFNFHFVYGQPNVLDAYWGAAGKRAWDGGFFGLIAWSVPMLAGTLAYDLVNQVASSGAARRLILCGAAAMVGGYLLCGLSTLYDRPTNASNEARLAESPVWPPWQQAAGRSWRSLLAEPPLFAPRPIAERPINYWMMCKRLASAPFMIFATGFALALYGVFVIVCDMWGQQSRIFQQLGENALAGYIIHHVVADSFHQIIPPDAPAWYALFGLAVFLGITYSFVRYLNRNGFYLRV